jgi:catechol 2,3-dioxygenase-like lactoylglutathione lyase family enzyme
MAKIKKVGHVVLGVRDPARSVKFYTEVLGMELVKVLDDMQVAFFSFGERDHDIAVIKVPEEQPVGSSGLAPHGPGDRRRPGAASRAVRAAQALWRPRRVHRRPRAHQERVFLRPRRQSPGDFLPGITRRQRQTVPTRGAGSRRRHAATGSRDGDVRRQPFELKRAHEPQWCVACRDADACGVSAQDREVRPPTRLRTAVTIRSQNLSLRDGCVRGP